MFAEIVTPGATLAIGSGETVALFKEGSAEPAANRTAIIEFQVDDIEAEFARLKDELEVSRAEDDALGQPRGSILRDPEGTLVSLYTPVTDAAKERFGSRIGHPPVPPRHLQQVPRRGAARAVPPSLPPPLRLAKDLGKTFSPSREWVLVVFFETFRNEPSFWRSGNASHFQL